MFFLSCGSRCLFQTPFRPSKSQCFPLHVILTRCSCFVIYRYISSHQFKLLRPPVTKYKTSSPQTHRLTTSSLEGPDAVFSPSMAVPPISLRNTSLLPFSGSKQRQFPPSLLCVHCWLGPVHWLLTTLDSFPLKQQQIRIALLLPPTTVYFPLRPKFSKKLSIPLSWYVHHLILKPNP